MVFKKIIFQNSLMANETPSRTPPPFMANAILNFHFDYVTTSLCAFAQLLPPCSELLKKISYFLSHFLHHHVSRSSASLLRHFLWRERGQLELKGSKITLSRPVNPTFQEKRQNWRKQRNNGSGIQIRNLFLG